MRRSSGLVALLFLVCACGDNIGTIDGPGTIDSRPIDGPPPGIDANLTRMRGMTLLIGDARLVDPETAAVGGVRGGGITVSFSDLTMNGGRTVGAGMSPIGGCQVIEYSDGLLGRATPPNPSIDAGPVTIANEGVTSGLLKTVGPCTFQAAAGNQYLCISHSQTAQAITATNPAAAPGEISYLFGTPTPAFPVPSGMITSAVRVNGFTDTNFNSGASAFPVVSQTGAMTLGLLNSAGEASATPEAITTGSFTIINGNSPIPQLGHPATDFDFLGTGDIRITKAANANWPAINTVVGVVGDGLALDAPAVDPSANPASLPLTDPAVTINFSCDFNTPANPSDDTCGDVTTSTALTAMILAGRATQKPLTGLLPFQMPTEIPGTDTWREVQCAYITSKSADLTADALSHLLGIETSPAVFTPTRIQMRVSYLAGGLFDGPNLGDDDTGRILVGHAVVGHTDP